MPPCESIACSQAWKHASAARYLAAFASAPHGFPPIDFRAQLNDEQFQAVTAEPGPLLVLELREDLAAGQFAQVKRLATGRDEDAIRNPRPRGNDIGKGHTGGKVRELGHGTFLAGGSAAKSSGDVGFTTEDTEITEGAQRRCRVDSPERTW